MQRLVVARASATPPVNTTRPVLSIDHVVGQIQRELEVLLDQHDRLALGLEPRDGPADFGDDQRREPFRRLVHQQHARIAHQRAADREHLLLAARERAGGLLLALLQAREHSNTRSRSTGACSPRGARCATIEVLAHRQRREDAPPLRHEADALARNRLRRQPRDRLAEQADLALARRQEADRSRSCRSSCRRRCGRAARARCPASSANDTSCSTWLSP